VGADDYLVKPLEPRELQLRLRNALSRSAHAPGMQAGPHRWAIGKGLFEAARRAIQLGDREVPLTTAEFRLIDLLVRHPNQGATPALTRTDSPVPRFEGRVLLVEDDRSAASFSQCSWYELGWSSIPPATARTPSDGLATWITT